LPITPITDLRIHQGDLIAATSGRAFWILDDMGLIRQYKSGDGLMLYQPEPALLVNGGSELNSSDESFTGMNSEEGVNPSSGVVIYYQLPELKAGETVQIDIRNASGEVVNSYSSVKDSTEKTWEGGPSAIPVLPSKKGLNRFVWNMRYPTIPGVPDTYFENSFSGHKASPGKYSITLTAGPKKETTTAEIVANPLYPVTQAEYEVYHRIMLDMEQKVTEMHRMINDLDGKRQQLDKLVSKLNGNTYAEIRKKAAELSSAMKAWDNDMVQRKSKAYDDVENFPNKFSANYMFLLNQTESDIPRVNQPNIDLKNQLDAQWSTLKSRGGEILNKKLPELNQILWSAGIGGIWE
jgi:hypothetical protein